MFRIRIPRLLALLLASTAAASSLTARADDFIVYSPYVTAGQSEVEFRGHQQSDGDPALDQERAYSLSFAHAFTSWWKTEVYLGRYEREPGSANTFEGYEFENVFQLSDPGQYWADVGFLASYEYNALPDQPGVVEFGPLFERHDGRLRQRLNFIWEKELGGGAGGKYEFRGTYLMTWSFSQALSPGFEAYYRPADDSRQIGPALYGEISSAHGSELEYSAAYLLGLNHSAPDRALVLRLEYEFF